MTAVCYTLFFIKDGEFRKYIGQTSDVQKRIKQHLVALQKGVHVNKTLQKLYNEGWVFTGFPLIVEFKDRKSALEMEQTMIRETRDDPEYVNIECGNDTFTNNPRKEEISRKLVSHLRTWRENLSEDESHQHALKLVGEGNGMFGKNHTVESRQLMSEKAFARHHEHGSPNKGIPKTKEHRLKMSENASKRIGSLNPFFGRKHNQETKNNLARLFKGRLPANTRKIIVNGVVYESATEAGRQLGVPVPTVLHRTNSSNPRFINWKWF